MTQQPQVNVKIHAPKRASRCDTITLAEYHAIRRLRQLRNQGADMAVIYLADNGPRVRTVGKVEG